MNVTLAVLMAWLFAVQTQDLLTHGCVAFLVFPLGFVRLLLTIIDIAYHRFDILNNVIFAALMTVMFTTRCRSPMLWLALYAPATESLDATTGLETTLDSNGARFLIWELRRRTMFMPTDSVMPAMLWSLSGDAPVFRDDRYRVDQVRDRWYYVR